MHVKGEKKNFKQNNKATALKKKKKESSKTYPDFPSF